MRGFNKAKRRRARDKDKAGMESVVEENESRGSSRSKAKKGNKEDPVQSLEEEPKEDTYQVLETPDGREGVVA
jgi:hypothetical protein